MIHWAMIDNMSRRLTGESTPSWRDDSPCKFGHILTSMIQMLSKPCRFLLDQRNLGRVGSPTVGCRGLPEALILFCIRKVADSYPARESHVRRTYSHLH